MGKKTNIERLHDMIPEIKSAYTANQIAVDRTRYFNPRYKVDAANTSDCEYFREATKVQKLYNIMKYQKNVSKKDLENVERYMIVLNDAPEEHLQWYHARSDFNIPELYYQYL